MKKRLWPFDDFQPVGLTDLLLSGIVTGTVIWPPFFGMLQCLGCFERFPLPFSAALFGRVVLALVAEGAALGLFCGSVVILGLYYRKRWISRFGPFAVAALLIAAVSWWLPQGFTDMGINIAWREESMRLSCGVLLALPAAWATVRLMLNTAAVHPYRDELSSPLPKGLR